jgi:hypothetical protein
LNKGIPFLFIFLFLIIGCTPSKSITSEQLTDFKQSIRSQYKVITDLQIQMAPTRIEFNYFIDKNADREKDKQIFTLTKELVLTEEFQKTIIEDTYFKKYPKGDQQSPKIIIRFHTDQKEEADYEYTSSYYGAGIEGAKDRPIDRYQTWFFNDFKKTPTPVKP